MAADSNYSVTEVTTTAITETSSVDRSSKIVANPIRHVRIQGDSYPSVDDQPVATARFENISEDIDVQNRNDLDDDHGYTSPVSSQNSVDQLVEEVAARGGSSDEEHPHTIKIARRCIEMKKRVETLEATHESHWRLLEIIEKENAALKNELQQLKTRSTQSEEETSKRIQLLESKIKEKDAITEMLQYGTQGKCGVCSKNHKIIDSHPYSKVVLETVLGANYSGILDLQQDKPLQPSSCKWKHLCGECDNATGDEEKAFKEHLVGVLEGCISVTSEKIYLSHADLFHVYTFRALLHNVDTHHYIPGLEENQGCTCSDLLHPLNNFRKRAHHLSRPLIWKDRPKDRLIDPFEAGMLFHVSHPEVSPDDHWIEFPIICKVHFESVQRSHYVIFAQIPPFYWAFPLPAESQDVPNTISDDMITSKMLVNAHYKEAMHDASQLSKDFEQIVAEVNRELQARRKPLDDRLQKWRDDLKKKKEDVLNKGQELEAKQQKRKEEQEELNKKVDEIKEKRETNRIRMNEIKEKIERLEKEVEETSIANQKKSLTRQLESLAATTREIIRDNVELNKKETEYNEDLEKKANEQEQLYAQKINLIKNGLCAVLEPKLMIGYFRAVSRCYLEIRL